MDLEGRILDPKKIPDYGWILGLDNKRLTGRILTDRFLGSDELLEFGAFELGGGGLQVLLNVVIYLDAPTLKISMVTVDAVAGSASMVGPPVDCDTIESDWDLVNETVGQFLTDPRP